jgi:glycosyltransferase involved in cell wall biosynthesis
MSKLSIFTTVTNPHLRGDNFNDALKCYLALADEVIIVNGGEDLGISDPKIKVIKSEWPYDFNWPFIGQQFQKGYEAATGDWVIHADLDFIFHEKDFANIRKAFDENPKLPAMSFWKYQFILPDRYNLKSRLVIAVNKKQFGNRILFNSGGDLCQPSLDGEEIRPDVTPEARVAFYNYEKMTKNFNQVQEDILRMALAWEKHFSEARLGFDAESAYEEWAKMVCGRFKKPQKEIPIEDHPIFVQKTIKNLTKEQWGYNGFGLLGVNNYV